MCNSISQLEHTSRGCVASPTLRRHPRGSLRTPHGNLHRLTQATIFVDIPLASSTQDGLLQKQPDEQRRFLDNVPHMARIAGIGVHELYKKQV